MTTWKTPAGWATVVLLVFLGLHMARSGDDQAKKDKPAAKPATSKAEKKLFRIEYSVKGILEPEEAIGIAHRPLPATGVPYAPGPLTVLKAVAHGTHVRQGDILVVFDTRRIDQAIKQVESELQLLEANIKLTEQEQPLFEKAAPHELEAAERAKKEADEDLAYYLKTGRKEAEKRAHQYVKFATFYLEYAQEQLRQLEKMYKANDLTEDTEKIILKRQRFFAEEAANDLKSAEIERDFVLKTVLPRREKSLRDRNLAQTLALEKARNTLGPAIIQKQQSLAKLRFEHDKLKNGLEMLRKDRAGFTITAPADGIVYYGKFSQGQWESAATLANRLVANGTVMPDEQFMTIVKAGQLVTRLAIDEKDVHQVKAGLGGKAQMTFHPDVKLPVKVTKMSAVPTAPGKFEALAVVEMPAGPATVVPGMACTCKFVPYVKKDAITVAAAAVLTEDDNHFVKVLEKNGKEQKRPVTVGRTADGRTEILSGLREGEEVVLEKSGDQKTPAGGGG